MMPSFPFTALDISTGSCSMLHAGAAAAGEGTEGPALTLGRRPVSSVACQSLPLAGDTFHSLHPIPARRRHCLAPKPPGVQCLVSQTPFLPPSMTAIITPCCAAPVPWPLSCLLSRPSGSCPSRAPTPGAPFSALLPPSLQLPSGGTPQLSSPRGASTLSGSRPHPQAGVGGACSRSAT